MKHLHIKIFLIFSSLFCLTDTIQAQDTFNSSSKPEYNRYCNIRFGFCVDYLETFKIDPPPENGDGRRFYHGDNFEMIVSGSLNVFNQSLTEVMRDSISCDNGYKPDVTYRFVDKMFFVVSGFCGKTIFYKKVYVGKEYINGLYLSFLKNDKSLYNDVVTHLSHSFKSGKLD